MRDLRRAQCVVPGKQRGSAGTSVAFLAEAKPKLGGAPSSFARLPRRMADPLQSPFIRQLSGACRDPACRGIYDVAGT